MTETPPAPHLDDCRTSKILSWTWSLVSVNIPDTNIDSLLFLRCYQSTMSKELAPDAWEADWESLADVCLFSAGTIVADTFQKQEKPESDTGKKVSSKVTKAQRRAAQAEFNRKLWEDAYAPPLIYIYIYIYIY
jgi:hypothetical protein